VLGISQPDVTVHIPAAVDDVRSIEPIFFEELDLAEYFSDDRVIITIWVNTGGEPVPETTSQELVSVFTREIRNVFGQCGVKVWVGYTSGHSDFNISFGRYLPISPDKAVEMVGVLEDEFQRITQQVSPMGRWQRIENPWDAYAY
jgi:hypothetical protein